MPDERPRVVSGEILPPDEVRQGSVQGGFPDLSFPPPAPRRGLLEVILQQHAFWGIARTMKAYRYAVETKIDAYRTLGDLYAAREALEERKVRWENIDVIRDAAKYRLLAELNEAAIRYNRSVADLRRSERALGDLESDNAVAEFDRMVRQFNAEAARDRAEAERDRNREALQKAKAGGKDDSFGKDLASLDDRMKDYRNLMAKKAEYAQEFGGEDKIPDFLLNLIDQMEDQLGFRKR